MAKQSDGSELTIEDKLARSEGVVSLRDERRIADSLETLNWAVAHGFYYRDPQSRKFREGDVLGRQILARRQGKRIAYTIDLTLLIECKSMIGYHLVFSAAAHLPIYRLPLTAWIGEEGKTRGRVFNTLHQSHLWGTSLPDVMQRFGRMAYPCGASLLSRLIVAPLGHHMASAFRETNIGNIKELEASVLWRASQSLQSAYRAMRREYISGTLSEIETGIRQKVGTEGRSGGARNELRRSLRQVALYHPVVVVNATLWHATPNQLESIPGIRLLQPDTSGLARWWVDVVTFDGFDTYIRNLTSHYIDAFAARRVYPLPMRELTNRLRELNEK